MIDMETHDFNTEREPPRSGLPSHWPILTARDIHKGATYRMTRLRGVDRNCACLTGWAGNLTSPFCKNWDHIMDAIVRAAEEMRPDYRPVLFVSHFNDDPKVSRHLLARVWNRAGALLGYVEGNPEA